MRLNAKKLTIVSVIALFLWLVFSFTSYIDVPKTVFSDRSVVNIENRILKLEKEMDEQLQESGKLLSKVKEQLKKITPAPDVVKPDSIPRGKINNYISGKFVTQFRIVSCKIKVILLFNNNKPY